MPQLFTNNARALLASGITDSATSLTVEASKADLFPTANVGSGSVPSTNNWFKATLQDSAGNVEIVYVRTRTAGSGVFSDVIRGQEGTTARAFSAGTVVGLRITAADIEGSIATANNSVQLTGDQTIGGVKTFSSQIVASGGVQGNVTGTASGNVTPSGAETLTNKTLITPDWTENVQVIGTNTNAVRSTTYILTASLTLTLPASPTAGDWVAVQNSSGTTTAVIARNGSNIMSLAEDLTIDADFVAVTLVYADSTRGWVFR